LGGLPWIAPLRLSGKNDGTVTGVGDDSVNHACRPDTYMASDNNSLNRYDEREPRPTAESRWSNPRRRYGRASSPIHTSMG
jgi:hypothetical protein